MAHREVINSHKLNTNCYIQLCKHTHYNYLYANLLKSDALQWITLKLNIFEIEVIDKS